MSNGKAYSILILLLSFQPSKEDPDIEKLVTDYLGKDAVKSKEAGDKLIKKGRAAIPSLLSHSSKRGVKLDRSFFNRLKWEAEKYNDNIDVRKKLQETRIDIVLDDTEILQVFHTITVRGASQEK